MEKITILCGMENQQKAAEFMGGVAAEMQLRGCRIESIKYDDLVIFTKYTQTCFFYSKTAQPLNGVKADAIFGFDPYKQRLAVYLKELAPYNVGKGLVDYICECEKNGPELEAKAKHDEAVKVFEETIRKHLDNQIYITATRHAGKTELMRRYIEELRKENNEPVFIASEWLKTNPHINHTTSTLPEIKDVIFNNPATIVFWADGTKTVVKADNEPYDPEKGLAMAIAKKVMGNKREYYHTFLHWLKKV